MEAVFDSIAAEWDSYRFAPEQVLPLFLALLSNRKKLVVLDAGCGTARNSIEIARRARTAQVIAIDVSRGMTYFARKRVKEAGLDKLVHVAKADFAVHIPLRASGVDVAFFISSLHHLKKREHATAFHEIQRVVKPGGLVFVSVWVRKKKGEQKGTQFHTTRTMRSGRRVPRFHYIFSKRELEKLGEANGFKVIDSFFECDGVRVVEGKGKNLCVAFRKITE